MKNLRIYLVLLASLGALSLFLWLGRSKGTYSAAKQDFALADTGSVSEIRIGSADLKANLIRKGTAWYVNGNPARSEAVRGLFVLISRLEVESPVSGENQLRIMSMMDSTATTVRIIMNDGREKSYRAVYDKVSNATYMIMKDSDMAFRTVVRGFREKNLLRFYMVDPRFWRSNILFSLSPGRIRSIIHKDTEDSLGSFHLRRDEDGAMLISGGSDPDSWKIPDKEKLGRYLSYFTDVRFESFCDPDRDTLQYGDQPSDILSVETTDAGHIIVECYPLWSEGPPRERNPELNYLYGWLEPEGECLVLKYVQIDLLLKDYAYFTGP